MAEDAKQGIPERQAVRHKQQSVENDNGLLSDHTTEDFNATYIDCSHTDCLCETRVLLDELGNPEKTTGLRSVGSYEGTRLAIESQI